MSDAANPTNLIEAGLIDRVALMLVLDIESYQTIRAWEKAGMPAIKVGRKSFYRLRDVIQWMEDRSKSANARAA